MSLDSLFCLGCVRRTRTHRRATDVALDAHQKTRCRIHSERPRLTDSWRVGQHWTRFERSIEPGGASSPFCTPSCSPLVLVLSAANAHNFEM